LGRGGGKRVEVVWRRGETEGGGGGGGMEGERARRRKRRGGLGGVRGNSRGKWEGGGRVVEGG